MLSTMLAYDDDLGKERNSVLNEAIPSWDRSLLHDQPNKNFYTMARFFFQILLAAASLVAGQSTTCPNEVAIYNPQDRTLSTINSECSIFRKQGRHYANDCRRLVPRSRAEGCCEESPQGVVPKYRQPKRTKLAVSSRRTKLPRGYASRYCQRRIKPTFVRLVSSLPQG